MEFIIFEIIIIIIIVLKPIAIHINSRTRHGTMTTTPHTTQMFDVMSMSVSMGIGVILVFLFQRRHFVQQRVDDVVIR